ncbi:branched-chain amino acid aminotransferase II [Aspergillus stella-maris]|uniref:branched-chain amino acid aminotransferase II n=1 Tax=Aspergillus stella-maris TaxID=1810926 RepID=UPI003CCE3EAB
MVYNLVPEKVQKPVPPVDDPVRSTQKATTAHMLQVPWTAEKGWGTPLIQAYGKIALHPTASVLHYATEAFEGMKVYRGYDGRIRLFRPNLNCARLQASNARVALPPFDPDALLNLICAFLAVECKRWLPDPGTNLYVRRAMIGSGEALGITVPTEALFFVFAALFPQPAARGRRLQCKVGASYGPALMAHGMAREQGCSQTLWLLDAAQGQDQLVTEAGASNFFVVWRDRASRALQLVTPSLDLGVVLPGVTRQSVLNSARDRLQGSSSSSSRLEPLSVVERPSFMDEIVLAQSEGRLVECFVTGTAVFITPVAEIKYRHDRVSMPMTVNAEGHESPVLVYSSAIKGWIEDIVYGRVEHEWGYVIDE